MGVELVDELVSFLKELSVDKVRNVLLLVLCPLLKYPYFLVLDVDQLQVPALLQVPGLHPALEIGLAILD